MPHKAISSCGPDAGVSIGNSPPLVPMAKLYWNMRDFLLENCALTQVALYRLGRTSDPNCVLCSEFEDTEHVLWLRPKLQPYRRSMLFALHLSISSCLKEERNCPE